MTKAHSSLFSRVMPFCAFTCFGCSPNSTAPAAAPTSPATTQARAVPSYTLDPSFPKAASVSFNTVSWVERDPNTKLIYVLQRSTPPVSAWTTSGALVSTWTTQALGDPHSLSFHANADASTSVWITDMAPPLPAGQGYGHCLKQFTLTGNPTSTIGTCAENSQGTGLSPVQFDEVTDIAWSRQGALLVSDGDLHGLNNRVLKLEPTGTVLANWSAPGDQPGSGAGQFNLPHALLVDRCERMWIADALNHRVQVLGTDGTYHGSLTSFGELGVYALEFGASFSAPAEAVLFVGASPTTGGGTGTVSLFAVPMNCAQLDVEALSPFAQFEVPIPASTSMTLLHSLTVDPETWDVYVAVLGGNLPPQKWVASWLGKPRPSAH
jgi:hypothetical protein